MNQEINLENQENPFIRKTPFWYLPLNVSWNILVYLSVMTVILVGIVPAISVVKVNSTKWGYVLALMGIILLLGFYTFLNSMSIYSLSFSTIHFKEQIFYALLSLNFFQLYLVIKKAIKLNLLKFKFQRWRILDITLMGMTIAAVLTLKAIDSILPPIPPLFVSLSLHYLALFFFVFVTGSLLKSLFIGVVSGFFMLLFPSTVFLTFQQFLFDYLIPTCCFSLSFFIVFKVNEQETKLQKLQWIVFIVIPFIFVLGSRIVAGVLFWNQGSWTGTSVWVFSTVINSINTGFDTLICLFLVPLVLKPLWFLKDKYEQVNNR